MAVRLTQTIAATGAALTFAMLPSAAQAASLDLSTWSKFGDVRATSAQAQLTNSVNPDTGLGNDDFVGPGAPTPINRNISGINPLFLATEPFEGALTLPSGALGLDAIEGSAIQTVLNVVAGDRFSFNWNFATFDSRNYDRAFIAINNVLNPKASNTAITLTGSSAFSRIFNEAGSYRVAIGLVDGTDVSESSILTVNNANLTAVPTPALLPGLMALGLRVAKRRRAPQH
jgi:hypothetical protein